MEIAPSSVSSNIPGSAKIAPDGSTAMLLPAGRAVTWQLTDETGEAVVRERYWLTFQAGEMRSCANCHGNNSVDQLNRPTVTNSPLALKTLLLDWNQRHPEAEAETTPYGFWSEMNLNGAPPEADSNGDGLSNLEAFIYGFGATGSIANDDLAKSLTPSVSRVGDKSYGELTFTQSEDSAHMQVIVESSTDLQNWQELALIQNWTTVRSDPSISVTTTRNANLRSRRLHAVTVRQLNPLDEKPSAYFRLRFQQDQPE